MERAARELACDSWILVQASSSLQVVGTALSFVSGSVGEGEFSVEDDRKKLVPVMKDMVRRQLVLSLQKGDLPCYRRHLNLQMVHWRGLDAEPLQSLLTDDEASSTPDEDPATAFLKQNGLVKVHAKDSSGFWPLHYAALSGHPQALEALLARCADPNRRTTKPDPRLGFPFWMSPLDLAVFYGHNHAAQLLIRARARLEGGLGPSMGLAAQNNAEGLRLLRAAGGDPLAKNFFGVSSLVNAASVGSLETMEELLSQAEHGPRELGRALSVAMANPRGSAQMVERLIGLRADVDFQYDLYRDVGRLGRLVVAAASLKHQLGRRTVLSSMSYHHHGRTPLMAAMQNAQHEGAAALIAAGARLDLRNCRNWTAADFARGQDIPSFLREGLEGDRAECRRVASLALHDGYVEMRI